MSQFNDYDLVVIGAGSGGLTSAIGAGTLGARVLLVEKEKIGGDCTHYGCIPSKALISLSHKRPNKNLNEIWEIIENRINLIYEHESPEKLSEYNVEVEFGSPRFIDTKSLELNNQVITAKKFIIATGSRPMIPEVPGLDTIPYLTNKTIFQSGDYESIAIIGAGIIGCEIGQALNNLGKQVHLIARSNNFLLPGDEQLSSLMRKVFIDKGIHLHSNQYIKSVQQNPNGQITLTLNGTHIQVDKVLLATGRLPNIEDLELDKANVKYTSKGISVKPNTQTSNSRIFAIGDVTTYPKFTHYANHMGKVALVNSLLRMNWKCEQSAIPKVIFTKPEVAILGSLESELISNNIKYHKLSRQYTGIDRAMATDDTIGYIDLLVNPKGYILGAVIVGANAGEMINLLSVAMNNKLSITQIASSIAGYPTYGFSLLQLCNQFKSIGFTPWKKKLLRLIYGMRGHTN